MTSFSEQTSADVAEEAENERAGLVNTLDKLRENLRPENMVDEMFSQAQANSSDIADKVWSVARANPLPAALIGLGAAMLVSATQRFRKNREPEATWAAPDLDDDMAAAAHKRGVTGYAMASYSPRSRTGLSRLLDEQPLILAALGVAVGAAVGSALPSTTAEAQWMGDASESMRRNASALARDQLSQLRSTASQTLDQMKATAAEHGISSENVSGLVHDLGEDVRTTAFSGERRADGSSAH